MTPGSSTRPYARRHALALIATIALGLGSRVLRLGIPLWDNSLGDTLYAVAAYLALALVAPRLRPVTLAALSLAFCVGVETFQLTGIPARYAHLLPVRLLLGTDFAPQDLLCYAVGVAVIAALDNYVLRAPAPDWKATTSGDRRSG